MKLFSKNEILSWFGVSLLCLLPTLIACMFAFPQADDYGYAELAMNHDWKQEFYRLYTEWSGRYTSIIMGFLSPLVFQAKALYGPVIFLSILFFILSSLLFFRRVLKPFNSGYFSSISGLLFSAVFFNIVPSPGESVFWYSGMITYLLPCSFLMISLSFLIAYLKESKPYQAILGGIFLLISLGGNEVLTLSVLITSFIILSLAKAAKSEYYTKISRLFILVLIGAGLLFTASGNFVREEYFSAEGSLFNYLVHSEIQLFRFLFTWLSNLSIWILFLISLVIGHYARLKNMQIPLLIKLNPFILYILPLVVIYSSILPAYLTMGILGQHRTLVPAFFFFLIWFNVLAFRIGYLSNFVGFLLPFLNKYTKVITVLFLGVMLFSGNNIKIINDLFQDNFESYFNDNLNRYKSIDESLKSDKILEIERFKKTPTSFHVMDIKEDSSHWINGNIARYYGLKEVKLKDD